MFGRSLGPILYLPRLARHVPQDANGAEYLRVMKLWSWKELQNACALLGEAKPCARIASILMGDWLCLTKTSGRGGKLW